jgi:hypothetical protein
VTLHSLFLPGEAGVELNTVWQIDDGRCPGLLSAYRRGGERSSAPPFRRWLAVVNKLVVILSEDVEHERASAFIGSIVDGTAIVTIRDLRKGRVCIARSTRSVSCTTRWSSTLSRASHDVIYFCKANVGFNVLEGETRLIRFRRGIVGPLGPISLLAFCRDCRGC